MYCLLLGLLSLICSTTVHGIMIRCFVGGIVKYDSTNDDIEQVYQEHCDKLEKESVLQKLYINQFGILISNRKDEWNKLLNVQIDTDNIDTPIIYRRDDVINSYSEITMESYNEPNLLTPFHGLKFSENEVKFEREMSMKSLHIEKSIVEYWDDVMNIGTDMHRLKFHSKLVTMYNNEYKFSREESMVFLMSSYSAVGIYYFTNNILIAQCVATDGLNFLKTAKSDLYNNIGDTGETEVVMWELLTYLAFVEVHNSRSLIEEDETNNLKALKHELDALRKKLNELISNGNEYPCSYLLMHRSKLLDKDQLYISENSMWHNYAELIYGGSIKICENRSDNRNLRIYTELILSVYYPGAENVIGLTFFYNLINALKIPVFTSEERLLNYKVTILAVKKINICVDKRGWKKNTNNSFCETLHRNRQHDLDLDRILMKLIYMRIQRITTYNFLLDIVITLGSIDEHVMHMIVMMAVDNLEPNFDSSLKRIDIVKGTIKKLKIYIKKVHRNSIINPSRVKLQTAYKWLAELYRVLCSISTKQSEITTHRINLKKSLTKAKMLIEHPYNYDDHLDFLIYKNICEDLFSSSYAWETHYESDGWIQKMRAYFGKTNVHSIFDGYSCDGVAKFVKTTNTFIHETDANILMFKHLMMKDSNDNSALNYLQNALSSWVVTSEDRVRNLEAHELYSMYFIWKNYRDVKNQGFRK